MHYILNRTFTGVEGRDQTFQGIFSSSYINYGHGRAFSFPGCLLLPLQREGRKDTPGTRLAGLWTYSRSSPCNHSCKRPALVTTTIVKPKLSKLSKTNYPKQITVFLDLRPDTSTFSLQLKFCFLLARHYIWCCKTSDKTPLLQSFIMVLKSQFYIESYKTRENSKKWQPLLPILTTN